MSALSSLLLNLDDKDDEEIHPVSPPAIEESTVAATASSSAAWCAFTEAPEEVRARIYDYLYEYEPTDDLLDPHRPTRALPLACRQLYAEARQPCYAAIRSWFNQDLVLQLPKDFMSHPSRMDIYSAVLDIDEDCINHITQLSINGEHVWLKLRGNGTWLRNRYPEPVEQMFHAHRRITMAQDAGHQHRSKSSISQSIESFISSTKQAFRRNSRFSLRDVSRGLTAPLERIIARKATSRPCLLLERLPAENRNQIYELAFTFTEPSDYVDLLEAQPPASHHLLLTCRQIYGELESYYEDARGRFWTETKFALHLDRKEPEKTKTTYRLLQGDDVREQQRKCCGWSENLNDEDVALITTLRIQYACSSTHESTLSWLYQSGIWTMLLPQEARKIFVPPERSHDVQVAGFEVRSLGAFTPFSSVCFLLDCAPPEIRDQIYELTFDFQAETVDLLQAKPPSKSLLLTCRKIHAEARSLQREAYRRYWTSTQFRIQVGQNGGRDKALVELLQGRSISEQEQREYGCAGELRDPRSSESSKVH